MPIPSKLSTVLFSGVCIYLVILFLQRCTHLSAQSSFFKYVSSIAWLQLPANLTPMPLNAEHVQDGELLASESNVSFVMTALEDVAKYGGCTQPGIRRGAMCACKHHVDLHFVHVPKGGGSSIACTFQPLKRHAPPNCRGTPNAGTTTTFQGVNHESYYYHLKYNLKCIGDVYQPGGANCAPADASNSCRPFVTFIVHPVARFLSAFYQNYNGAKYSKLDSKAYCNFLRCRRDSPLAAMYKVGKASLTPSAFALWRDEDVQQGYNLQTWMLGSSGDGDSVDDSEGQQPTASINTAPARNMRGFAFPREPLRDNPRGRAILARAKARLDAMDFVGITGRFTDSLALLSWQLGVPIEKFCSCNLNPFKPLNVTSEAITAIESRNSLDLLLYQHASSLFEKRLIEFKRKSAPEPFVCNTGEMLCKSPANGGVYVSSAQHQRENRKIIRSGKHSVCSYECRRATLPLPLPPPKLER